MATSKKTGKEYLDPILDEKIPSARITKEFLSAMPDLSSSAIRLYLYFMKWINYEYKGSIVEASYATIQSESGIKDRTALSNAILELVETGWIADIVQRFNAPSIYKINVIAKVNKDLVASLKGKRNQMKNSKKSFSSRENHTGRFSKKSEVSSRENQTASSWENPTNGGMENPTLSNTITNTNTNTTEIFLFDKEGSTSLTDSPTPPKIATRKEISKAIATRQKELIETSKEYASLKEDFTNGDGSAYEKMLEMQASLKHTATQQLQDEGII